MWKDRLTAYNDEGIRTSKTVNGVTTTYTVADGVLRRMTIGSGETATTLQFFENSVLYNGTEYWYVFNAQNDVVGLIDNTGAYVVEYTYDAWGRLLSTTGTLAETLGKDNPFRYRGYIYDEETGWYYCNSRYYDPAIGRWINADGQISGVGGDALGYNTFAYCFNNPIIYTDSTGRFPWLVVAIIGACAVAGAYFGWNAPHSLVPQMSEPSYPTVEQSPVDFNALNEISNKVDEFQDQNKINSFINRNNDSSIKPQFETPVKTVSPQLSAFRSDNILDIKVDENGLTTQDKVVNAFIGAGVGLMIGGTGLILTGVVGALAGVSVLGGTAAQVFSWGALAYDIPAMFFIPLFGIETEMVELGG